MTSQALTDVLARIERATGVYPEVLREFDTISNSAFLLDLAGSRVVCRLHSVGFGAPVTDHARELRIHQLAADAGLSPAIVHADSDAGILLTDFVAVGSFDAQQLVEKPALEALAACLQRLHALPLPESLGGYSLTEAAACYLRRAGNNATATLAGLASLVGQHESLAEQQHVLCHRDLLYSNILNTRPVQLIDWEFASPGERWFDLAAVIAWHELSASATRWLLDAYLGRPMAREERSALARAVESFQALCTLWSVEPG
ncbi:MAG: phosphotransferase [Pseudomonadota bacterium]